MHFQIKVSSSLTLKFNRLNFKDVVVVVVAVGGGGGVVVVVVVEHV